MPVVARPSLIAAATVQRKRAAAAADYIPNRYAAPTTWETIAHQNKRTAEAVPTSE